MSKYRVVLVKPEVKVVTVESTSEWMAGKQAIEEAKKKDSKGRYKVEFVFNEGE